MKHLQQLFLAALVVSLAVSCSRENRVTAQVPVVLLSIGDVKVKSKGKDLLSVQVGQIIKKGDIIITGSNSQVSIQMGKHSMVQLISNTTFEARSLFEDDNMEFFLKKGTVLSKVDKLNKNGSYKVKTITSIAAVRGTTFSVTVNNGMSTVGVSHGKVKMINSDSGHSKILEKGAAADDKQGNIVVRKLSKNESLELSKADIMSYIDNAEKMTSAEIIEKTGSYVPQFKKIDREIEASREVEPKSLKDIRARYGHIDVITLYSGKVIRGAVISRGNNLTVLTPYGKITISKNKVSKMILQ
jgi:hypothetical protein